MKENGTPETLRDIEEIHATLEKAVALWNDAVSGHASRIEMELSEAFIAIRSDYREGLRSSGLDEVPGLLGGFLRGIPERIVSGDDGEIAPDDWVRGFKREVLSRLLREFGKTATREEMIGLVAEAGLRFEEDPPTGRVILPVRIVETWGGALLISGTFPDGREFLGKIVRRRYLREKEFRLFVDDRIAPEVRRFISTREEAEEVERWGDKWSDLERDEDRKRTGKVPTYKKNGGTI